MTSTRSSVQSRSTGDDSKPTQSKSAKSQAPNAASQPKVTAAAAVNAADEYSEALKEVAALQKFTETGHVFTTTKVNVNDAASAEYAISVVKHVYSSCVIVQYGVRNTLDDQILSNMTIKITGLQAEGLKVAGVVGLPEGESIKSGVMKFIYVVLQRDSSVEYPGCKISQKLTFTITEIDVDTEEEVGSYEEDYSVSDVQLVLSDYMRAEILPSGQFKDYWEQIGSNT